MQVFAILSLITLGILLLLPSKTNTEKTLADAGVLHCRHCGGRYLTHIKNGLWRCRLCLMEFHDNIEQKEDENDRSE